MKDRSSYVATYSLGSLIDDNNIKTMVKFAEYCRTAKTEGWEHLSLKLLVFITWRNDEEINIAFRAMFERHTITASCKIAERIVSGSAPVDSWLFFCSTCKYLAVSHYYKIEQKKDLGHTRWSIETAWTEWCAFRPIRTILGLYARLSSSRIPENEERKIYIYTFQKWDF